MLIVPHSLSRSVKIWAPVLIFLTYALGCYARMVGIGWDAFNSLHADERHIAFAVSGAIARFHTSGIRLTEVLYHWFDTESSILNPRTNVNFYVYGDFPQGLVVFETLLLSRSTWAEIIELGRANSIIFDTLTILVVAYGAYLVKGWNAAALAALLYAAIPLSLQNSNFFAVDIALTFFSGLYAVGLMLFHRSQSWRHALLAGLALGMAMACKLSAVVLVPSALITFAIYNYGHGRQSRTAISLLRCVCILAFALLTFRIMNSICVRRPGSFWRRASAWIY